MTISAEFEQAIFNLMNALKACPNCEICGKHRETLERFTKIGE